MKHKKLCYAYESSPHATDYNKGKGCYLIFDHGISSEPNPKVFQNGEKLLACDFFESTPDIVMDPWSHTRKTLTKGFALSDLQDPVRHWIRD